MGKGDPQNDYHNRTPHRSHHVPVLPTRGCHPCGTELSRLCPPADRCRLKTFSTHCVTFLYFAVRHTDPHTHPYGILVSTRTQNGNFSKEGGPWRTRRYQN